MAGLKTFNNPSHIDRISSFIKSSVSFWVTKRQCRSEHISPSVLLRSTLCSLDRYKWTQKLPWADYWPFHGLRGLMQELITSQMRSGCTSLFGIHDINCGRTGESKYPQYDFELYGLRLNYCVWKPVCHPMYIEILYTFFHYCLGIWWTFVIHQFVLQKNEIY